MRITAFILLAACLQVSARGHAQGITLSLRNAPLETVFREIQRQTGYNFVYNDRLMEQASPVDLQVDHASVEQVLAQCFLGQPLTYTILENTIVVKAKPTPVFQAGATSSPPLGEVHGTITSDDGETIPEATITVKGTKNIISANSKGEFTLKNVDANATLIITSVGYEPTEILIKGRPAINISLKRMVSQLDETQIIAYGTTTQRFSVGSYSKVSAEDIDEQPVSNPLAALEGRVPGLVINQTSGVPGASFNVQIRGQNTIAANPSSSILPIDNPLFIIDGVPFSPQNNNINQFSSLASPGISTIYGNPHGGISPFNSINPSDIESIEVLRDADATAIYGSRGANGVILITTKKGKQGKTRFNANVWSGESQVTHIMPMLNTRQYLQMRHEAFNNDNLTPSSNPNSSAYAPDLLIYDTTKYTDWQKYFQGGMAHTVDANASVSGGNSNTQFLIGSGYHNESFILPGGYSDRRASFNMNLHHKSTDQRLLLDFSSNYSYDQNNSASQPTVLKAFTLPPDYPTLVNPDGTINWEYKGINLGSNPMSYLKQTYTDKTYNLLANLQIAYQIMAGLVIRSSFGYNTMNVNEYAAEPLSSQNPADNPVSMANFGTNNFQTWIIEPQAEYKKQISNGRLDVLVGSTFQQNTNTSTQINAFNYSNDALLGSISAAGSTTSSDGYSLYKYSAAFGRINYIWSNEYIIDLTGRRDGSSRFGPGKQFGNFGSVGAGWLYSEEALIKKMFPSVSYGKLRMSYGTTGNDNVGDYQYLSNWGPIPNSTYQGVSTYQPSNLYNPNFSWAVNKKLEAGFEIGFFKNRILSNFTWYDNRCGNQLTTYLLPSQAGFTSVTENFPALVQNTGWEIQLSSVNIKTKKFTWNTSFNLTIPKNKLVSFPGIATSSYANTYLVGQPLSVLRKYKYIGVNDTTGVYQYLSAKGIPTYSPVPNTDYYAIGNTDPKFYGGLRNTFSLKGFELDIFMQFTKQLGENYLGQINNYPPGSGYGNTQYNQPTSVLARWQNTGDETSIQKFTSKTSGTPAAKSAINYFTKSSGSFSDASFIRFKTLSFSYSLNSNIVRKIKMEGCRLYISAQNLFTITGYKGNDPENSSFYSIPPLKTVIAGIQFTF